MVTTQWKINYFIKKEWSMKRQSFIFRFPIQFVEFSADFKRLSQLDGISFSELSQFLQSLDWVQFKKIIKSLRLKLLRLKLHQFVWLMLYELSLVRRTWTCDCIFFPCRYSIFPWLVSKSKITIYLIWQCRPILRDVSQYLTQVLSPYPHDTRGSSCIERFRLNDQPKSGSLALINGITSFVE